MLATAVVVIFGVMPESLINVMQAAAAPMLTDPVTLPPPDAREAAFLKPTKPAPAATQAQPPVRPGYSPAQQKRMRGTINAGQSETPKAAGKTAGKKAAAAKTKAAAPPAGKRSTPAQKKSD